MKKRDWRVALISAAGTLCVVLIVALILRLCSFEIVYDPKVITNWDAVAGVAAWVGVFMSFVAILFAIWVPIRIANRQDKIALFEKKYNCYMAVQHLYEFSNIVKDKNSYKELKNAYLIWSRQYEHYNESTIAMRIITENQKIEQIVVSGNFLFQEYDVEKIQTAVWRMNEFLIFVFASQETDLSLSIPLEVIDKRNEFCNICKEFREEYILSMEAELNLKEK